MGVPIPNLRPGRKLKTVVITVAWLSKLEDKSRSKRKFGEMVEYNLITNINNTGKTPISISY
jgi:hypothetical protein